MEETYTEKVLIDCICAACEANGILVDELPMAKFDAIKMELRDRVYKKKGRYIEYATLNMRGIKMEGGY